MNEKQEASLKPNTTAQQDLTHAGQRKVNLIWEGTQSLIAVLISVAVIYASMTKVLSPELTNAFFLIIGFYFSRTNHSNIGGTGIKPVTDYQGR